MKARVFLLAAIVLGSTSIGIAADWPQWMGPQRDNVWREEGIVTELPGGRPEGRLARLRSPAAMPVPPSPMARSSSPTTSPPTT